MTKRIVKDYFLAFRWENFKGKMAKSLFFMVYFSVIFPSCVNFYEKWENVLVYFLITIPAIHIFYSGVIHIMKMPKIMYMVPLTQDMRREYIVKSAIFRICFCSLLGMVCTLPLVFMGICRVVTYMVLVYEFVTFAILACGINEMNGIEKREIWPEVKCDNIGLIHGANTFLTVIMLYGIACNLCWDDEIENVYVNLIFIISAILVQLSLTIKYMSYWNKAVEKALNYETSFDK